MTRLSRAALESARDTVRDILAAAAVAACFLGFIAALRAAPHKLAH